MWSIVFAVMAISLTSAWAQEEDRSWLAKVVKPDVHDVQLVWAWEADSSRLVIDGIVVDWRDSTDAQFAGRRFLKTVNCLPDGSLKSNGDSVVITPPAARITQVERIESIGIYRLTLPLRSVGGEPLSAPPRGVLLVNLTAGKLIDRKYSIEMTRQFAVELP